MVKLANAHHKKAGAPILISDKINFIAKNVTWDKSCFLMIYGTIQQEDILLLNMYAIYNRVKISDSKSIRTSRRNEKIHNYKQRF